MTESVAEFVHRHDAGRVPELLALRYHRMQADALAFFRGSAPLYYARFWAEPLLGASPVAWLCGDAHVENFGSFRGDNRLVYFDVNDFDEAVLGPVLWDVGRLAVSVLLAAARFGLPPAERQALAQDLLAAYAAALAAGKPYQLERATARGVVRHLLEAVAQRRQRELLTGRARRRGSWHLLPAKAANLRALPADERHAVFQALEAWRQEQGHPPCGPLLDVAGRIAGVGSLGVRRYAVLAQALLPSKLPRLLDLKAASAAAPAAHCPGPQPTWATEAVRVVAAQVRLQAVPPALLQPLVLEGQPCVLRELQPVADKLDFTNFTRGATSFRAAVPTFGRLLAWAHLRAAAHQGAAGPDDLIAFGQTAADWLPGLLHFATVAKAEVREDFHSFRLACRAGHLPTAP